MMSRQVSKAGKDRKALTYCFGISMLLWLIGFN
jgi:hypothetical protein